MEPTITIAGLWLLFGGAHIGLATRRVRGALVARLGETGFLALFSTVAALSFALLVRTYAVLRFDGAQGPALGAVPGLRGVLIAAPVTGIVLMAGSFASYAVSPYALLGARHDGRARGLESITRHAFFVGVTLFAGAHALLATRLVGSVAFGSLALLAVLGAWHQDRKLLALRGDRYARYLAATSALPFAAILGGRQRLVLRDLPWRHLAVGLAVAAVLRRVHAHVFAANGAWVIGVVVGGAALLTAESLWRARRDRAKAAPRAVPV